MDRKRISILGLALVLLLLTALALAETTSRHSVSKKTVHHQSKHKAVHRRGKVRHKKQQAKRKPVAIIPVEKPVQTVTKPEPLAGVICVQQPDTPAQQAPTAFVAPRSRNVLKRFFVSLANHLRHPGEEPESPAQSWVSEMRTEQANPLAAALGEFIAQQLPPASSTLILVPTSKRQEENAFTPALTSTLRKAGFAIANPGSAVTDAHTIRYLVSPMDEGLLVRVQIDQKTEATRWYLKDTTNHLQAASPFSIREIANDPK